MAYKILLGAHLYRSQVPTSIGTRYPMDAAVAQGPAMEGHRVQAGSALKPLEDTFCPQELHIPPHLLTTCVAGTNKFYRQCDGHNHTNSLRFNADDADANAKTGYVLVMENDPSKKFYVDSLIMNSQSGFCQCMSSFTSARTGDHPQSFEPVTVKIPADITENERFVQTCRT